MIDHWPFVIAAYGAAAAVILAMIVWVAADYRRVSRRLAEMEAQGPRRRAER